jgi:hypothetical protein
MQRHWSYKRFLGIPRSGDKAVRAYHCCLFTINRCLLLGGCPSCFSTINLYQDRTHHVKTSQQKLFIMKQIIIAIIIIATTMTCC